MNIDVIQRMSRCLGIIASLACMLVAIPGAVAQTGTAGVDSAKIRFQANTHAVVLDNQGKIVPWTTPQSRAYDVFLRRRWDFVKHAPASPGPEPRSRYPQYYFYCAYRPKDGKLVPDTWMNDVGEKIPNWLESARLYYAYTGDSSVMRIAEDLVAYALEHGTTPATFAWPNFPHTTTNAGDTIYQGFTSAKRFDLHEIQVDHASEMGLAYYRLYEYTGNEKYKEAALDVANTLVEKVWPGSATQSPWPYLVVMDSGKIKSAYGANWTGAYTLFDDLIKANVGKVEAYRRACDYVKDFMLKYPLRTGYWTDGHSDNPVYDNTYKSNLSCSNFTLFMFDFPEFNPAWKSDIPKLIRWTEENFIKRGAEGEPANMWGANIVGEQDSFLYKMDYQTARYAAECARWYALSGDASYKEKAYRALNWVTYCSDENGMAFESPLSKGISSWWSDCYGEGPRMFYHVFAAIPEWAPPGEDHILYSESVLTKVSYQPGTVAYSSSDNSGMEYLRVSFKPASVTINRSKLPPRTDTSEEGYTVRSLGGGDYALTITRRRAGEVVVAGAASLVNVNAALSQNRPEPADWHTGDIHVHRNCGGKNVLDESQLALMMETNDLAVISVLADMGNGEVLHSREDLPKVTGKDAAESAPGRIIHWDAEWHWDATYSAFEHQALGGHLVLLGLKNAHQIWDESAYKVLDWAHKQGAIGGFCHMQYLNDEVQGSLNCCIPIEYPVEAALGTMDYLSEDVYANISKNNGTYNSEAAINAYYKLLNCGFHLSLAAGTDYPCNANEPFGSLLTYVHVKGKPLTYDHWVDGIRSGHTVVSRNAHNEFLDMKVNEEYEPGDEIKMRKNGKVSVRVQWTAAAELTGRIEVVSNGRVVAVQPGTAAPGHPVTLRADVDIPASAWICARRMDQNGHQTHTAPVYVTVKKKPVRASAEDAQFFVRWIDNLLAKTAPRGEWNKYFTADYATVQGRYLKARKVYVKIAAECR